MARWVHRDPGAVHPGKNARDSDLVGYEEPLEQGGFEDQITFDQEKGLLDLTPSQPQRVDIVGRSVDRIADVLDDEVAGTVIEK